MRTKKKCSVFSCRVSNPASLVRIPPRYLVMAISTLDPIPWPLFTYVQLTPPVR
jgi:hypothetical protein